jgi:hypothetical protein
MGPVGSVRVAADKRPLSAACHSFERMIAGFRVSATWDCSADRPGDMGDRGGSGW